MTERANNAKTASGSWRLFGRGRPNVDIAVLSVFVLVASVIAVFQLPGAHTPIEDSGWPALLVVGIAFAVAELTVFHFQFRREAIGFSVSEVPAAIALVFLSPIAAVAVRVVASSAALLSMRRPPLHKFLFNVSLFAMEMTAAVWLFDILIEGGGAPSSRLVPAAFATLVVTGCLGSILLTFVISRYEGDFLARTITVVKLEWWLFAVNAAIACMMLALVLLSPWLAFVGLMPISAAWYVLKAFGAINQRLRDLHDVHGFTGRVGHSLDPADIAEAGVTEAARLLRADSTVLVLFADDNVVLTRSVGRQVLRLPRSTNDPRWAILLASEGAQMVTGAALRDLQIGNQSVQQMIFATIRDETGPIGMLAVTGRSGAVNRFDANDVSRVQDLAEQLSSSLRRGMLHQRIETEARHDGLTGLPNRTAFERHVIEVIDRHDGNGVLSMLLLDLDRFKEVNDTLGHHAGDELLVVFARRMSARLRATDKMARLAGDEFAIIAYRETDEQMQELARSCLEEAGRPVTLDGLEIVVTASVGIARLEEGDGDAAGPMRRADIAMYNAKTERLGVETYRPELDRRTPARLSMLGDLRSAIEGGRLHTHYQPKLDLTNGTVIGAEALVRWTHEVRGNVPPTDFVRVAEDTGLVKQLTDLMLASGIGALKDIHDRGFMLGLSVNLSTHDLLDSRLPDRIAGYLSMHDVDPRLLTAEITESSLLSDAPRSRATINELSEIGVRLSIDDFGTGYSSLSYLRRLPVSELKIDKSFVANVLLDDQDEVIVRSTIDLGHNLGLEVVAEGVESAEVLDRLRAFGCDVAQGHSISRPLDKKHFIAWLNTTVHPSRTEDPLDATVWGPPHAPTGT